MTESEILRAKFRPDRIFTLFIGESAPAGGTFFYAGNSQFYRYTRAVLNGGEAFLNEFMGRGWFLDDLVSKPCNYNSRAERRRLHSAAIPSLAERLADYRPLAVVSAMRAIRSVVDQALVKSNLTDVAHYNLPFPGNGQQTKFKNELQAILPKLPKSKDRLL